MKFKRIEIAADGVRSLYWDGDGLVDPIAGTTYRLDGTVKRGCDFGPYRFDSHLRSPSGDFNVLFERRGTKAVLRTGYSVVREFDRSYYFAGEYEFPLALFRLPDGREAMVHCPGGYNRLQIDDLAIGARLSPPPAPEPADIFHSRLAANPAGTHLISAGWIWHPLNTLNVYDVQRALSEPGYLESPGDVPCDAVEVSSAAFVDDDHVVIATSSDQSLDAEDCGGPQPIEPASLGLWSLRDRRFASRAKLYEEPGTVVPFGEDRVLCLHGFPKLVRLSTGEFLNRWTDLPTGTQVGSIVNACGPVPPFAADAASGRFAVAGQNGITVIEVDS